MEGQGKAGRKGKGDTAKEGLDFIFSVGGESFLEV